MGTDIHVFGETRKSPKHDWELTYNDERRYFGRDYELFSRLAMVRGEHQDSLKPLGLPTDLSAGLRELSKEIDWAHSHTYFEMANFFNILNQFNNSEYDYCAAAVYEPVKEVLTKQLEIYQVDNILLGYKNETEARIVIWFDS